MTLHALCASCTEPCACSGHAGSSPIPCTGIWDGNPKLRGPCDLRQVVTGGELPDLPGLRMLNLKHCPRLHDAGLAAVVTSCPRLSELHMHAEELTGGGLACLTVLTGLTRLELLDARAAAADGLAAAVAALTGLEARPMQRSGVFAIFTSWHTVLAGIERFNLVVSVLGRHGGVSQLCSPGPLGLRVPAYESGHHFCGCLGRAQDRCRARPVANTAGSSTGCAQGFCMPRNTAARLASAQELKVARTMKSFSPDGRESDEASGLVTAARAAGAARGLLEVTDGYYPTCQGSLLRPLPLYIFL